MSIEIECEKRMMLSESEYYHITSLLEEEYGPFTYKFLRNRYFDTKDFDLLKRHYVLRIRSELDGDRVLTLKIKGEDGDLEISEEMNNYWLRNVLERNSFPDGEVKKALEERGIQTKQLMFYGILETRRLEIKFKDHLLVLDINYYNGKSDYNLEIEAKSKQKAKDVILHYCDKYHLEYQDDCLSKSRRFFNSLKTK